MLPTRQAQRSDTAAPKQASPQTDTQSAESLPEASPTPLRTAYSPRILTPQNLMQLQRTVGNHAVAQIMQRRVQPQTSSTAQRIALQRDSNFIQRSSTEADAGPAAEQDRQVAAQKLEVARINIESFRATGQITDLKVVDPFVGLPQVHAGAVATRRTVPFTVNRGNGPETFRVPVQELPMYIEQCKQRNWPYQIHGLPRGYNLQMQRDDTIRRAATPSGYGGGTMNENAAKPNAIAAPNLVNGTLTFNGVTARSTSTGASGSDLNRQPLGSGVGATRPHQWTDFIAMIGAVNPFKQGHQMYQYLGGDGTHDNLAPFTGSLNALHFSRVENHVWMQTDDTQRDQYANYSVTPVYGGNGGIVAWAQAQFANMPPNQQRAAMVTAGVMPGPAAAAYANGAPLLPADLLAANNWIAAYVNAAFPTRIDCTATFIDDAGGGNYIATNPQTVQITNDF